MKRLELDDFRLYHCLTSVCLSPNGQTAAFVATKVNSEKDGYDSWLCLYSYARGETTQFPGISSIKAPFWLDDETLLYQAGADAKPGEVWTVYRQLNIASGEIADYMRIPARVFGIWPLEDGRFVLKCEYNGNYPGLHSVDEQERALALAEQKANEDYIVADELPFRHDGEGYSNNIRKRLAIFDRNTGALEFLSRDLAEVEHIDVYGGKIVYTAHQIAKERRMLYPTGIFRYDLATGETEELIDENTYRIRTVGHIGGEIVFSGSNLQRYGNQENPWFYVLRDGKPVVFASNEESAMASVASDCRYTGAGASYRVKEEGIYYLSTVGGDTVIRLASMDGSIKTLTKRNGTVESFDVGANGITCIALKNYQPQELYHVSDGEETALTNFNGWVVRERTIVKPERLPFENCGTQMEGWVIKPANYDPEKKYPGILCIHGGHKCAYGGNVYYHEMQLWANEGFFVFFCNPRGSDGGDNDFAEIIGRYGEIDYHDLMKFTDVVLASYPQIDAGNLAVTGGSYGGYMTNWVIGHTDRFKCASSQCSIASYISMFGTSDTGYSFPMFGFRTNIWEDFGRYWSHSPLKYADKVRTPTLFVASENDYRCPTSEAIQMYSALKLHGVEARLCIFKDECHMICRSGKPSHKTRRWQEITGWFHAHCDQ